jgi:outer membrane receptor protein involved in Fe transport
MLVSSSPASRPAAGLLFVGAGLALAGLAQAQDPPPAPLRESVTVVSGVAPGIDLLPASAATSVTEEGIEQRAPERLVNILESVAGASKLGEGADSVPALRGLGRGRILILIDGARVTAERRAGPSATFVEPASLGGFEVARGPGSVIYGSDAFGGVINAITRDPEPGGFRLRFLLEGAADRMDSQNGYLAASAELAGGQLFADGYGGSADDAEAGDGVAIDNSAYDSHGGSLRYLRDTTRGRLRFSLSADRTVDLGKAAIDSNVTRAVYPDEQSDRLQVSWIGAPGSSWESLEAAASYGTYRIVLDRERLPFPGTSRRIDRADNDAHDASLRWVGSRELYGGRFQVGVESHSRFGLEAIFNRTEYAADGVTVSRFTPSTPIEDAYQWTTGVFSTWNKPLSSRFSLGLGLRGDRIEVKNDGGYFGDDAQSESPVSGNLALTFVPAEKWSATVQVARGFRVPSLSDRYFRGPSGRGFVTGNPLLEPEKSLQYDLALRWDGVSWGGGRTSVAAYAYRYQIDDLIERYGSGNDFFFRNRGEAVIEGAEIEAQTRFDSGWSSELGIAATTGEADGDDIDDMPAPNAWVNLRKTFGSFYAFGRVSAFAEKDDPGPTEEVRPGFTIYDIGGGWHINQRLELRAVVRNLGDKLYFAAADEAADLSPGRSITVGLSGRF